MKVTNLYWELHNFSRFTALLLIALLFVSCSEEQPESAKASPLLSIVISSNVDSYSLLNEMIMFDYQVTNSGVVSLAGTVSISNDRMLVVCPDLVTIGNNDANFDPNESVICASTYVIKQRDLDARHIVNTVVASIAGVSSAESSITINNIAESLFIFPFDSIDPSVVFRTKLNSADAILLAGGVEEDGSLNEFDNLLGMKPGVGSGAPGCRFTYSMISELASLPEGQLSIEVEREWLAITDPEVGSTGYDHLEIEYLMSFGSSDIDFGRLYMQPDESLLLRFIPGEGTRNAHFVNSNKSSRFARITMSWNTNEASLYVDGLLIGKIARVNKTDSRFANIFLGTAAGANANSFGNTYYMRNLIVASKPVVSSSTPLLRHIMHIGDSFAAGVPLFNTLAKYDGTIVNTVIRELFGKGIGYGEFTVYSNGGGKIQDNSNDPLELDVDGGGKTRLEALAGDPTLIVFITGGNDLDIFQENLFIRDLHDHVEAFLGVNGHVATNVKHVIVTTTTSNLSASSSNLLAMRDIMLALPDWWDTAYPSLSGRVHVIDMWTIFGGLDVDHSLFGIADTVHPSAAGNIVYGKFIADEIARLTR